MGKVKEAIETVKSALTGKPIPKRNDNSGPVMDALISYSSDGGTYVGLSALRNSDVFAAVRKIAGDIADTKINYSAGSDQARIERLVNRQPNPNMNSWSFWFAIMVSALINGNSFATISRNDSGQINRLDYQPNSIVTVKENDNGELIYYVDKKRIRSADILHFKVFTPDGKKGIPPLYALIDQMKVQNSKNDLIHNFFDSGFMGNSVLTVNGTNLDNAAKANLRNQFEKVNGSTNRTLVLDDTMKFESLPVDKSVVEVANSVDWSTREIAACFGLSPDALGVESDHSNASQTQLNYLQSTLTYYFRCITSELDSKLAAQNSDFSFDTSSMFTADPNSTYKMLENAVNNNLLTINEARKKIGLPPVDGGEQLMIEKENSKNEQ